MAAADAPKIEQGEPVALVLGAGGARGIAHVGVLKVLSNRADAYSQRHVAMLETLASFIGSTLNSALEHAKQLLAAAAAEVPAKRSRR